MQPSPWSALRRLRPNRVEVALLFSALLVLSFGMGAVGAAAPAAGATDHPTPAAPATTTPAVASVHPAQGANTTTANGTFFAENAAFASIPDNQSVCQTDTDFFNNSPSYLEYLYFNDCINGPQYPSVVSFGGTDIGVGYSALTNQSVTQPCLLVNETVTSVVDFVTSSNSGTTFGSPVEIANDTCAYVNSIEPSFALSSTGTLYGAFVEENATNASYPVIGPGYNNRTTDALGFTESTDDGANFTNVTTLTIAGANIANPKIATFGDSVYIVYENVQNATNLTLLSTSYSPNATYPESVELIASSNGGASWLGPYNLPGQNASEDYTAESPAIAVNATGALAISYSTNRTCVIYYGYCYDYGGAIVVATSTTNGSSWVGPVTVTPFAGESACSYYNPIEYYCIWGLYDWGPVSTVSFSPTNPSTIYVAWVAGYYTWNPAISNESGSGSSNDIGYGSALFDAVSTNGGATWVRSHIIEPESSDGYDYDYVNEPDLTVAANGEVYVSFQWLNETYSCTGCNPVFEDAPSYWIGESANGIGWSTYPVAVADAYVYDAQDEWLGLTSAITVTSAGPVAVYAGATTYTFSFGQYQNYSATPQIYDYWYNYSYNSVLIAAFPSTAAPLAVNFTETGLPAGTPWTLSISGNVFTASTPTIEILNLPYGSTVYVSSPPVSISSWTEYFGIVGVPDEYAFYFSFNVTISFSIYYGFGVAVPGLGLTGLSSTGIGEIYLDFYYYDAQTGQDYEFDWYTEEFFGAWYNDTYEEPSFPWFFASNSTLDLYEYVDSDIPISYVYGAGNGSYTGTPSNALVTFDGPINETFFLGVLGSYAVTFSESGLPSGTAYSFDFAGQTYSGTAPDPVIVSNVYTGAYSLTDVSAVSATPGWEYFGTTGASTVEVPVSVDVVLNFSTYIDVGATSGAIGFHAAGLAAGDYWQITFNGTAYGSSTPWINVSGSPGTYLVGAYPVAASANDSVAYQAVGFGPTLSVTPGSTYLVSYSVTYRVDVSAAVGGAVSGAGSHWFAPGATASYTATTDAAYSFLGWVGAGAGSYSGDSATANITANGPISETATFQPLPLARFNLTVTESGLPAGTTWTVELNGTGYSSDQPTFSIPDLYACGTAGGLGQYSVQVPWVAGASSGVEYRSSSYPGSVCTNGASTMTVAFHTEYLVTPYVSGNGSIDVNGAPSDQSQWVAAGSSISMTAYPANGYAFTGWLGTGDGSYNGSLQTINVVPAGPVTELATFAQVIPPVIDYSLSFEAPSTFVAGTAWSITVNGTAYASESEWINISALPPGTYPLTVAVAYSPDHGARYTPTNPPASIDLDMNRSVPLAYSTAYEVAISSEGSGSVSPSGGAYRSADSTVAITATPASGSVFVGWAGTGTGAYSGTVANDTITVNGPITEVADFAAAPSTSSSSTPWISTPIGIGVLAAVGLLVGIGVGYAVFGRKGSGGGTSGGGAA